MTTLDLRAKKILGQQRNVQRYCRLLATDLTDLERQYLHKRIPEEHAALDRLAMEMNVPPDQALNLLLSCCAIRLRRVL
jgi:hypothetical protein